MRRLLTVLLLCLAAGVGIYFFEKSPQTPPKAPSPDAVASPRTEPRAETGSVATQIGTPSVDRPQPASIPEAVNSPSPATNHAAATLIQVAPGADPSTLAAATVLENMRTTIRQYGSRFGGNPVGTNPEITRALNGDNPKNVKFIPADAGLRINEKGELVDPWGTPYFFHQLSAMQMEIRSAGPDKTMWTEDDLVTK
jgi:hypothetical protein